MAEFFDHSRFIKGEKFRLAIIGIYPNDLKCKWLINLATIIVYLLTIGQYWTMMSLAFHSTTLAIISEIFLFSMTQVSFINKLINFHMKVKHVLTLEEMICKNIFRKITTEELKIIKEDFRKCQRVTDMFLVLCVAVVVFYGVFPAIDKKQPGKKNYPFPGEFPFNPDNYYLLVYFGECLTVAISAWTNSSIDCLFYKHTTIATTLCKILCEKLKNILDDTEPQSKVVANRLRQCVIYYDEINNYVSLIQKTFSNGIFMQFLCSVVIICLTGFQVMLVVPYKSAKFMLMIFYLLCMMCQVSMYCWYGQLLKEKSNEITRACYAMKWEEMTIRDQKTLIIILERAKRPMELSASGVFKLNISTMMTILRTSYSYFAVLRQIYKT